MDVLGFVTLIVTGFVSCAEFGSYAFVHPVIRHLPQEHYIRVEQGLLKTFGRVMPVLMPLCAILSIAYAVYTQEPQDTAGIIRWMSAVSFIAASMFTIGFNVPINLATGKWDAENPPSNWQEMRNRWEFFQGVRSWLLLIGFVLLSLAVTLRS